MAADLCANCEDEEVVFSLGEAQNEDDIPLADFVRVEKMGVIAIMPYARFPAVEVPEGQPMPEGSAVGYIQIYSGIDQGGRRVRFYATRPVEDAAFDAIFLTPEEAVRALEADLYEQREAARQGRGSLAPVQVVF